MSDAGRLAAVLGSPELAWLRERVRSHAAAGRDQPAEFRRKDPDDAERRAIAALLGRRARLAGALVVVREDLEAELRRSGIWERGLVEAVELLDGPIEVRDDVARRAAAAWAAAFAPLRAAAPAGGRAPEVVAVLDAWVDELERSGRVRTLTGSSPEHAAPVLEQLAAVVTALPAAGETLPVFAARVLGSAHALDDAQPVAGLAARAAEIIGGGGPRPDGIPEASRRRDAWASVGVRRDELSSTVLVLNLPGNVATSAGRMLEEGRREAQPLVLTLRQLADVESVLGPPGPTVSICENPSVVATAAERLALSSGPLVCTSGQPGAATVALLAGLRRAGAELRHHGDFDPGGVAIAGYLRSRLGVVPWRFGTADYRAALEAMGERGLASCRAWPTDEALRTPWDPPLADAMRDAGVRVEEEHVLDGLLDDLAAS